MQAASFRDAHLSLIACASGGLTSLDVREAISRTGLRIESDRRLAGLDEALRAAESDPSLDLAEFCDLMSGDGGLLAMSALRGELAVPSFASFKRQLCDIFDAISATDPVGAPEAPPRDPPSLAVFDASYPEARNADYIPALSTAIDAWGAAVCTVDGQRVGLGDSDRRFSIQSCCKPVNYAQALETFNAISTGKRPNPGGHETADAKLHRLRERGESRKINRFDHFEEMERSLGVHDFIGAEPSGDAFNEFSFNHLRMPYNPMINAGAVMCSALVSKAGPTDIELEQVQRAWADLAGLSEMPMPDTKTAKGEDRTGSNNRSLAYKMLANEAFPAFVRSDEQVESVLDFYFHCCALMMNAEEMSVAAATLANRGICPITGARVFHPDTVRDTLASMLHCGMYDSSGRFGRITGLPAKSGVGGAIMLIVPGVMGVCTFSPRLDRIGNSLRGLRFIEKLLDTYALHMLDASGSITANTSDPTEPAVRCVAGPMHKIMAAAELGDVTAFKRFENLSVDRASYTQLLEQSDYDNRTPLHLAACEGHRELTKYLIGEGINVSPEDRWGSTPLDDAMRLCQDDVVGFLRDAGAQPGANTRPCVDGAEVERLRQLFLERERPHRSNVLEDVELILAASMDFQSHIRRHAACGARVLVADYDDRTPLHLACAEGAHRVVEFFIRYFRAVDERREHGEERLGYLLSWPDRWGHTPLDELVIRSDGSGEFQKSEQELRDAGAMTMEQLLGQSALA
ncbi:MAG: glutaminase [Planctomycetota bacterium]